MNSRFSSAWLVLLPFLLVGCGVMETVPKKTLPTGLIATPTSYYSTPKARYLGGKYKENLDRLVERIVRNPKTAGLQFSNNISSVGGIGFFTHSAAKTTDERYLEVILGAPDTFDTKGDYSAKVYRLFSIYGTELLSILASDSDIYQESEVSGYGLNFSWRTVAPEGTGGRVILERAIVYFPKQQVKEFLKQEINQNAFLREAVIFAVEEDGPMNLVSYRPQEAKPDFRPPIREENLAVAPPETKPQANQELKTPLSQLPGDMPAAVAKVERPGEENKKTQAAAEEKAAPAVPPRPAVKSDDSKDVASLAPKPAPVPIRPLTADAQPTKIERPAEAKAQDAVASEKASLGRASEINPVVKAPALGSDQAVAVIPKNMETPAPVNAQTPQAPVMQKSEEQLKDNLAPTRKSVEASTVPTTGLQATTGESAALSTPVPQSAKSSAQIEPMERPQEIAKEEVAVSPTKPLAQEKKLEVANVPSLRAPQSAAAMVAPVQTIDSSKREEIPAPAAVKPEPPKISSQPVEEKRVEPVPLTPHAAVPTPEVRSAEQLAAKVPVPSPTLEEPKPEPVIANPKIVVTVPEVKAQDQTVEAGKVSAPPAPPRVVEQTKAEAVPMAPKAAPKISEVKSPAAAAQPRQEKVVEKAVPEQLASLKNKPMESLSEPKIPSRPAPRTLEGFIIQMAFAEPAEAKRWAETLEHRGYVVSITEPSGGGTLRLRMGNFPARSDAERQLQRLRQDGLSGIILNLPQAYQPELPTPAAEKANTSIP